MHETRAAQRAAYAAAVLFAVRLVTFFVPSIRDATAASSPLVAELSTLLGIAPHLLLFPVVAAVPAPPWARAAGWGWLVVDMATDIMGLNGVAGPVYLSLKYGGHLSAALWTVVASWPAGRAIRWVGGLYALNLASYSFIATFIPAFWLAPSLILLPTWLVLLGRRLPHP